MDSFSKYHPIVNFTYFIVVFILSMFIINPIFIAISLVCAITYSIYLSGRKSVRFGLFYLLPMMLMIVIINPAFNHRGVTILTYLPTGNPLTLESIIYGVSSACLMAGVVMWFRCFNNVITADKFMYLFGRIIPSLSLVLSMTIRFVPQFKIQFNKVRDAQKCIGKDISDGTILVRLKNMTRIFSVMITWSLENGVETATSMKSRGYGLKGRTAYSLFSFEKRDFSALSVIIVLSAYIFTGMASGVVDFKFYPAIKPPQMTMFSASVYFAYSALCIIPMILNVREDIKWKSIKSRI